MPPPLGCLEATQLTWPSILFIESGRPRPTPVGQTPGGYFWHRLGTGPRCGVSGAAEAVFVAAVRRSRSLIVELTREEVTAYLPPMSAFRTWVVEWYCRIERDDIPDWLRAVGLTIGGIVGFVVIDVVAWYLMVVPSP